MKKMDGGIEILFVVKIYKWITQILLSLWVIQKETFISCNEGNRAPKSVLSYEGIPEGAKCADGGRVSGRHHRHSTFK